ncbi:hypothetical protein [Sulfurospirillum sp.]|uniref:hypothetical protein n=1 Tax=Sulfurospirillum sp. TaxID=2053622 RepID=UPI002FDC878D
MENEKQKTLADSARKLPHKWKVVVISCLLFLCLLGVFFIINFFNILMLYKIIANLTRDTTQIVTGEGKDLGAALAAVGPAMLNLIGVFLFDVLFSAYLAFYTTNSFLQKKYNNIPFLQNPISIIALFVSVSGMTAIAFAFAKDHHIVLISSLFGSDFITQKNSEIATIIIMSLVITYLTIKRLKRGVE